MATDCKQDQSLQMKSAMRMICGIMKANCTAMMVLMLLNIGAAVAKEPSVKQGNKWAEGRVSADALDRVTKCAIGRFRRCNIKNAISRGLFETGLTPTFPETMRCRTIDEGYAISYTHKRNRENYHGGIDMPAPWKTPIVAAADGLVVGKFHGHNSYRGMEIVLRHAPKDTGIPLWIYTQYSHFDKMPKQKVGQRVRMGEILGPTGNSGKGLKDRQFSRRRPAIHFGVFYSTSDKYTIIRDRVIPVDAQWMDPVALYRKKLPLDSPSMKSLPAAEKAVRISVMMDNGEVIPANSKIIWPYTCIGE